MGHGKSGVVVGVMVIDGSQEVRGGGGHGNGMVA